MEEPSKPKKVPKPKKPSETLREPCGNEVLRFGLTKRRAETVRCDRCLGKVKVSAGILLRICRGESVVVCGACRGLPGEPEERRVVE